MTTYYIVTESPFAEDEAEGTLPWVYEETGFISWVDEVFLEGYKDQSTMKAVVTLEEALELLRGSGYAVEVTQLPPKLRSILRACQGEYSGLVIQETRAYLRGKAMGALLHADVENPLRRDLEQWIINDFSGEMPDGS